MIRDGVFVPVFRSALLSVCLCVPGIASAAAQTFEELAQQCAPGIHPQTLAAVVGHESNFDPLAIGVKGVSVKVRSIEEAVSSATRLIAEGRSVDMGLGQINANNLRRLGLTVREVFDPCINLAASARILTENYQEARRYFSDEQAALNAALSQYNTGNRVSGLKNGYVAKVRRQAGLPPPIAVPVPSTQGIQSTGNRGEAASPYAAFGGENQAKYAAFGGGGATAIPLVTNDGAEWNRAVAPNASAVPRPKVASETELGSRVGLVENNTNPSSTRLAGTQWSSP